MNVDLSDQLLGDFRIQVCCIVNTILKVCVFTRMFLANVTKCIITFIAEYFYVNVQKEINNFLWIFIPVALIMLSTFL